MNSAVNNFNWVAARQNVLDYFFNNVDPCTAGQTSATFGISTSGDCWNVVTAGMYWRTSCLACTSTPCTVLPIELISFDAICNDSGIELDWKTATEKDTKFYTLLRSENGIDFSPITTLAATNKNSTTSYSYTDKRTLAGITYYYKLTHTDFDGKTNDAGDIKHAACRKKVHQLDIHPNPSENEITVFSSDNMNNATIKIIDQLGQTAKTFSNFSLSADEKTSLDIHELKNGYYQLLIINGENISRQRFVVYK